GHGHRRHLLPRHLGDQLPVLRRPVQHRILGVNMQVDEVFGHGDRAPVGAAAAGGTNTLNPLAVRQPLTRRRVARRAGRISLDMTGGWLRPVSAIVTVGASAAWAALLLAQPRPDTQEPATLQDLRLVAVLLIVSGTLAALGGRARWSVAFLGLIGLIVA